MKRSRIEKRLIEWDKALGDGMGYVLFGDPRPTESVKSVNKRKRQYKSGVYKKTFKG